MKNDVELARELDNLLKQEENAGRFCVKLKDAIFIKNFNNDDEVCIIDNSTGEILGAVGQEELHLISFFTGKITLEKMLEDLNDYDEEDIKEFIIQLFEQKIINYSIS